MRTSTSSVSGWSSYGVSTPTHDHSTSSSPPIEGSGCWVRRRCPAGARGPSGSRRPARRAAGRDRLRRDGQPGRARRAAGCPVTGRAAPPGGAWSSGAGHVPAVTPADSPEFFTRRAGTPRRRPLSGYCSPSPPRVLRDLGQRGGAARPDGHVTLGPVPAQDPRLVRHPGRARLDPAASTRVPRRLWVHVVGVRAVGPARNASNLLRQRCSDFPWRLPAGSSRWVRWPSSSSGLRSGGGAHHGRCGSPVAWPSPGCTWCPVSTASG